MCRAMKRTDAERWRTDAQRRRWFRGGKGRGRAVRGARRCHPCVPRKPVPLRPVNVRGHRAKGMRAPENTNQFLMTEKYRLHALRSDSVDSGSDSDAELTDMDTYLCAWEHAHGALLDPDTEGTRGTRETRETRGTRGTRETRETRGTPETRETRGTRGTRETRETRGTPETRETRGTRGRGDGPGGARTLVLVDTDEDSVQYVPSEDDLRLSDNFMHRDFTEFCHAVTS